MIEVERASAADFVRSRFMKPACYLGTNGPKMTDIVEHFNSQYVNSFHERKKERKTEGCIDKANSSRYAIRT